MDDRELAPPPPNEETAHQRSRFGVSTFVHDIGRFVRLAERQGTRLVDLVERWVEATERNAIATERHAKATERHATATERLAGTMGGGDDGSSE